MKRLLPILALSLVFAAPPAYCAHKKPLARGTPIDLDHPNAPKKTPTEQTALQYFSYVLPYLPTDLVKQEHAACTWDGTMYHNAIGGNGCDVYYSPSEKSTWKLLFWGEAAQPGMVYVRRIFKKESGKWVAMVEFTDHADLAYVAHGARRYASTSPTDTKETAPTAPKAQEAPPTIADLPTSKPALGTLIIKELLKRSR